MSMPKTILVILLILLSNVIIAQKKFTFELYGGATYNIPLPLTISQSGYPDIKLSGARYYSEPFRSPFYWNWRISYWNDSSCWEFEATHHKLYLENLPPEVTKFDISHGLNLLHINRGWKIRGFVLRAGLGVVFAHPENTVRGMALSTDQAILNWGYYICGVSMHLAAGKRFYIYKNLFAALETRFTGCYAKVQVAGGHADVWSSSLHATFGLGCDF